MQDPLELVMVHCMERVQCLCLRHSHRLLLRNDPPHRHLRHSLNLSGTPSLALATALAAALATAALAAAALATPIAAALATTFAAAAFAAAALAASALAAAALAAALAAAAAKLPWRELLSCDADDTDLGE